jgi:hypothetical protein
VDLCRVNENSESHVWEWSESHRFRLRCCSNQPLTDPSVWFIPNLRFCLNVRRTTRICVVVRVPNNELACESWTRFLVGHLWCFGQDLGPLD